MSGPRNLPDTSPVAGHSQESQTAAVWGRNGKIPMVREGWGMRFVN